MAEAERMYAKCVQNWENGHDMQFPQRNQWASMAINNLGKLGAEKQATDEQAEVVARPWFERALQVDPSNPLALDNLAIILLEHREYQALVDAASSQAARARGSVSALLYRGCGLAGLAEYDKAAQDLKTALDAAKCRHVSPRTRATALQVLVSMSSRPGMRGLADKAAAELRLLSRGPQPVPTRTGASSDDLTHSRESTTIPRKK